MPAYVALLRAINLGGQRTILKDDLRAMFEGAGATQVTTYIQSGNVVFAHAARSPATLAARLEQHLATAAGFAVPVILRTPLEMAAVIANLPFADAPEADVAAYCFAVAPPPDALAAIAAAKYAPERFALIGRELYLAVPNGLGNARLPGALTRVPAIAAGTARTWRTLRKLDELVRGVAGASARRRSR